MMTKHVTTFLSTVTLLASVTTAAAEEIKIGTGGLSEDYPNAIVPAISEAIQEYGYTAVANTAGSHQENLDNLLSGTMPVALSPLDVVALNMTPEKDPDESLLLIGGKMVPEALFCVAYKGNNVLSYDDLTDEQETPIKISVGEENSTTARTFQRLMTLDPELKKIKLFYKENTRIELNRLLSGRRDLVCFVARANPEHELIKRVMKQDDLFFISINHPSFANAKIGNIRLYDIQEIPVSKGIFGFNPKTVKTLVTWVGVVVNETQVDNKLLDALDIVVRKPDLLSKTLATKAKRLFDKVKSRVEEVVDY